MTPGRPVLPFQRLLFFLALLLLWLEGTSAGLLSARPMISDGTFLLRSRRPQNTAQFAGRLARDPVFAREVALRARLTAPLQSSDVNAKEIDFLAFNFGTSQYEVRRAVLRAIGTSCYVFAARDSEGGSSSLTADTFQQVQKTFDEKIYPMVSRWFGTVQLPASFQLPDQKIYILLLDIRDGMSGGYVAGYFDSADLQPEPLYEGNRMPVFFMDVNPGFPGNPADKNNDFYRTLAHEFQHMVNFSRHMSPRNQEERWIDEGLSGYAEYLYSASLGGFGVPPSPHLSRFLEQPEIVLTDSSETEWFSEATLFRHYGASFLFIYYLVEKYGGASDDERAAFLRSCVDNASVGINGLNTLLAEKSTNFVRVLKDWLTANHFNLLGQNRDLWGYQDKVRRLGPEADRLPLTGKTHVYSASQRSTFGGQGISRANAGKYESITGNGLLSLGFRAVEPAMTPFLAGVRANGETWTRDLLLDETGVGRLQVDLTDFQRLVLIPAVATTQADVSQAFAYTFAADGQAMRVFPIPNPAFPREFIIVVKSETALADTPQAMVRFSNIQAPAELSAADDSRRVFVGNYTIPGSGDGQVTVRVGTETSTFSFYASVLKEGVTAHLQLREADVALRSRAAEDHALLFEMSEIDVPTELQILSRPYELTFNGGNVIETRLTFNVDASAENDGQIGIWNRKDSDNPWLRASRSDRGWFSAVSRDGLYMLVSDRSPPRIHDPRVEQKHDQPVLMARLTDGGSGVKPESVRVEADGQAIPFQLDADTGVVAADVSHLSRGEHLFCIEVADRADNRERAVIRQNLIGPLTVAQTIAWPNPCRGSAQLAVILEGAGSDDPGTEVEARIYDVSGERLAVLDLNHAGNRTFSARWDLRTESGKTVANGVYIYKVTIRRGDDVRKTQGKLAVLN